MTQRNRSRVRAAPHRSSVARLSLGAAAVAAVLGLASCGGSDNNDNNNGGGNTQPASNTPPASASADVNGFIAYLQTVVPTMPENTEPLDVSAFVAPTTDTAEPSPI